MPGILVKPGDIVTTGKKSSVVIVVGKNAFLVNDESHVELIGDRQAASGTHRPVSLKGLRVKVGKVLSVFETGARRITTPAAVAGVRGTGIYVESNPDFTYVCTCYGIADLEATSFPGVQETVVTRHHEAPRYIFASCPGRPILPAPMLNHTDEELTMLEALVGRVPQFSKNAKPSYY